MPLRPSAGKASFITVVSAAVVVVAAVLAAVKFFQDRAGSAGEKPASAEAALALATQASDERAVELARKKYRRELRYCEALGQFEGADLNCLADFAAEHKDLFFCSEIPAAWRESCVKRVAVASGAGKLCQGVRQPALQLECYLGAAATGDGSACGGLADPGARKACQAVARSDAAGCEAVNDAATRTACYERVAVRTGNPDLCENVRNKQLGDQFQPQLYECWRAVAASRVSPSDCDRIPHEGIHVNTLGWNVWRDCRNRVAQRKAGAECREGPADLTCYGKLAAAKGDLGMCGNTRSYTDGDICALTYALRRNDGSACGKISDGRLKTACADIVASGS